MFQHMLHLVPTLTTVPCLKTYFSYKVLKFSFVQKAIPDTTNLATVFVSLFTILGVEYDIAFYTNTTMPGLVLLKVRYILTLFTQF